MNEELQFNRIYEKTKDFGRTQFVREIQMQINDNKRLQQENQKYKEVIDKIDKYINDYNVFEVFSFPLMKRWEEEQVDYLRRSIERKEETIIELEHERVPYENKYVEELKKQLEELREENSRYERKNQKYKEVIDKAKTKLEQEITFCQNDSQGLYDKCNIAINRDKRILNILKEVE